MFFASFFSFSFVDKTIQRDESIFPVTEIL